MQKLDAAELYLNIRKSKFSVKKTKYLSFIIKARQGIQIDSKKVTTIRAQELPKLVTSIRSFLGFANFY